MDLSKLSTKDLIALRDNNVSALSDDGLLFLKQSLAPPLTEEERADRQGFGAAFGSSLGQYYTSGLRGVGEALDIEPLKKAAKEREFREKAEPSFIPTTEEDVSKAYEQGLFSGLGTSAQKYLTEPAGEMAGQFVAPAAAGVAATLAAPTLGLGAAGSFLLAGSAMALTELAPAIGDTIQRMEQEGKPVDVEKATAYAIPQAVLYGFGLPGVGVLPKGIQKIFKTKADDVVERVLAGKLTSEEGVKTLSGTISSIIKETAIAGGTGAGTVVGAEALKRAAAEQGLTDEEALDAYLQQALAAGAVAPLFGLPLGIGRARGARKRVEAAGAERESVVAAEKRAADEALAQQQALTEKGMLFSPEEMGGERVGPPELRETPEVAQPPAFSRFELTERERILNDALDDIRTRNQQAAESGDFATVEALSYQADTLNKELTSIKAALKEAGGAAKNIDQLQKERVGLVKQIQKAAAEGDTAKTQQLAQRIKQIDDTMPVDDLFSRADQRDAELAKQAAERSAVVDEELAKRAESDRDLISRMAEILDSETKNNASKYAESFDDRSRQEILQAQQKIDRVKRSIEEVVASGDLRPIPRLRNRLAELISESAVGRPETRRNKALEDQMSSVEVIRSSIDDLLGGRFLGKGSRETALAASTPKGLVKKAQEAVNAYADAAVREVSALRAQNNKKPLSNSEAIRLAMDVRGHLENAIKNKNAAALRIGKGNISPIEKQLAQIKKKYHEGSPLRQRAEGFALRQEQDVLEALRREKAKKVKNKEKIELLEQQVKTLKEEDARLAEARLLEKEAEGRERRVADMGIPGEGRQMQLFGADELKPIATLRATPENFMRYLRSGEVQKLRAKLQPVEKQLSELKKELSGDAARLASLQNIDTLKGRLSEIEHVLAPLAKDLNDIWFAPSNAAKRVKEARSKVQKLVEQVKSVDKKQNEIIAKQERASKDASPEATTVRTELAQQFNDARNKRETFVKELKAAKKELRAATKQQRQIASTRSEQLKNIDSLRGTVDTLRKEKLELDKKIADTQDKLVEDLKRKNATPEQVKAAKDAATKSRVEIGKLEAEIRNQQEAQAKAKDVAAQTALEKAEVAPKTVRTVSKQRLTYKDFEAQIKDDRTRIKQEKAKDQPDQARISKLEARIKENREYAKYDRETAKLRARYEAETKKPSAERDLAKEADLYKEIEARKTFRARTSEAVKSETQYKSREDIDAEQRARQADIADQLRGRKMPPTLGRIGSEIVKEEGTKQALLKEYEKAKARVAKAKQVLATRKTEKGKATAKKALDEHVKERDAIEADLRNSNKHITQLKKTHEEALAEAAKDRKERGRFSPDELRKSLKRAQSAREEAVKNLEYAEKQLAAATTDAKKVVAKEAVMDAKRSLDIMNTAIEMRGQKLDEAERMLAALGDKPPREERKKPLKGAGERTEVARKQLFDYDAFLKKAGLDWKTVDDFESPDGTVFRVGKAVDQPISPEGAKRVGDALSKAVPSNVDFNPVPTFAALPAEVKKHLLEQNGIAEGSDIARGVRGFVMPDGKVFVVLENHANARDIETTFVHELIGHVATDRLLGPEGMKKLSSRIEAMPDGAYGLAKALGIEENFRGAMADAALTIKSLSDKGASKADIDRAMKNMEITAARELLAYTAEKRVSEDLRQKLGRWYKEIVGAFRDWMRRSGMAELSKVSDADIYNIVRNALRAYNKNALGAHRNMDGSVAFRRGNAVYAPSFDGDLVKAADSIIQKDKKWTDGIKASTIGMQLAHRIVDRFTGLDYIARKSKGMLGSLEGVQMMYFNRLYDQRNNMTADIVTHGPTKLVKKADGTFMFERSKSPSLKNIFEELNSAKKEFGSAQAVVDQFGLYLAVERAAGDPKGLVEGLRKLDLSGKISMDQANKILKMGRGNDTFQKARQMYREYNNGLIDLMVDTGRFTAEEAKRFKSGDYVPYYRERNGEIWDMERNIRIGDVKNQPYLQQLVGGDSAIVNFEVGALQNTRMLTDMALGNVSTKNTAYTLQTLGIAEIRDGDGPAAPNVIRFYKDGKQQHAVINTSGNARKFEERLAQMRAAGKTGTDQYKKLSALADKAAQSEALFGDIPADLIVKGMDGISLELPAAISFLRGPANLLRKAVTRNPAYAVRIALKDSLYGWMTSGADVKPVIDAVSNVKKAWRGDAPAIKKLQEQGIIGGHVFSGTMDDMRSIALQIANGQNGWEKAMAKADRLAILADESARVTLYDGFIKKGMSELEATLATLESQNFTKHGFSPSVRYLSTMIPFFNSQIQGLNVLGRALTGKSLFEDKLGVRKALMQRGAMVAGGTMLYAMMMQDNEAYKNATMDERLNYWFVQIPFFDEPIRVSIPFEAGAIFKALPEAVINMASKDNDSKDVMNAISKMALNAIPGSSNLLLPQGAKPLIEIATNTSFFGMRPIEGVRAQQEVPGMRFGANTTEASKAVGELLNISPLKIDHFVNGYTGPLGIALLSAFNPILRDNNAPAMKANEIPIFGGFFQPTDGSGIINSTYEAMKDLEQKRTTFMRLSELDPKKAEQYLRSNERDLENMSLAGSFRREMGKLNSEERLIRADKQMSSQEKRTLLNNIKQAKIELASEYRKVMRE